MYSNLLSPHLTLSLINNNKLKSTYGTHATSSFPCLCSLNQAWIIFSVFFSPLLANQFILYSSLGGKKNRVQWQLWCLSSYKCSMTLHYRIKKSYLFLSHFKINQLYLLQKFKLKNMQRDKNPSSLLSISYNTTPFSVNI